MRKKGCSICGVTATWIVNRRGEEPLCDEHMDWLRANVTTMPPFREVGSTKREQHAVRQRRYAAKQREKGVPKPKDSAETKRRYYLRNKASILQKQKTYRKRNADLIARTKQTYYEHNRETFTRLYRQRKKDVTK